MTVMQIVQQLFGSMGITMEIVFCYTDYIADSRSWSGPDSYVKESDIVSDCQSFIFLSCVVHH